MNHTTRKSSIVYNYVIINIDSSYNKPEYFETIGEAEQKVRELVNEDGTDISDLFIYSINRIVEIIHSDIKLK